MTNLFVFEYLSFVIPINVVRKDIQKFCMITNCKLNAKFSNNMCNLPYDVPKDSQLTYDFYTFSWRMWTNHVIFGCWRMYSVHHNVSIPLWWVLNTFQERNNILSIDIVSPTLALGLDYKLCGRFHCLFKGSSTFISLKNENGDSRRKNLKKIQIDHCRFDRWFWQTCNRNLPWHLRNKGQ